MRGDRVGKAKIMAGLWLYTALATPRALGLPSLRSRTDLEQRIPGIDSARLRGGGSYIDAATDDARLALAVLHTAKREGALALSRVSAVSIEDTQRGPVTLLRDEETGDEFELQTKAVVLAGGPSTDALLSITKFAAGKGPAPNEPWTAPTRGSHIVLPRTRLPTDGAVIFTSAVDGRVMFLIPWPNHTIVGTTDIDDEQANPKAGSKRQRPRATVDEVRYLLERGAYRARREPVHDRWRQTDGLSERSGEARALIDEYDGNWTRGKSIAHTELAIGRRPGRAHPPACLVALDARREPSAVSRSTGDRLGLSLRSEERRGAGVLRQPPWRHGRHRRPHALGRARLGRLQ
jgi:glycerol-3-phosphate dehydrogenase